MKTHLHRSIQAFLFFVTCTSLFAANAPRPNILYLYVDDMGWGSIGPNGQAERKEKGLPYVMTPNLDKLAANGVNFRRGYGCTVCSPARSSQQTGFHQGHTFADRNDPDNAKKAIRTEDVTMGDTLAAAGYVTGYWGKWGYGGSADKKNPTLDNIQTLPTTHGYQHVVAELHHVRAHTFFQPTLWTAPAAPGTAGGLVLKPNSLSKYANNTAYPNYPAVQDHENYPDTAYCDDTYAFAALDFVRAQAQNYNRTGQPFFGLFAAQIPHAPFDEISKLPEWNAAYKDKPFFNKLSKQSQQWAAMVTRIDAHFGNLLAALEDPNGDGDKSDSVAANTLVVFQSDNGGPGGSCRSELDSNGGLSGSKGGIQEGGIRVPTIISWPSKITSASKLKAGSNTNIIIDATDMLPTFCELAGASIPTGIDGVSLAPTLAGTGNQRKRDFLIHEAGGNASIIQGNYKLVMARGNSRPAKNKAGKNKKTKAKPATGHKTALYDLTKDHREKNNLAATHPELTSKLQALLLGERVTEPAGFANTYHSWAGKNNAPTSDANNWSDYIYENAGKTYTTDRGAPQASWTATMHNQNATANIANATGNLDLLSLEISGKKAPQQLNVNTGITVTGRNEIRVGANGTLNIQGATVSSLRWLDIQSGGTLRGAGTVQADLYVQGTLAIPLGQQIVVDGNAYLGGQLVLDAAASAPHPTSQNAIMLKATRITGKFKNSEVRIGADRYTISYEPTAVHIIKL